MALAIGNNAMTGAYLGANQVRRAYKGGTLVYQGFSPASEQEFIEQTAAGGPAQLLKCYGKTIVNNQLVQNYDFSDGTNGWTAYRATASVTGGVATITPTVTDNTVGVATPIAAGTKWIEGHKYAIICRFKGNVGKTISFSAYYGTISGLAAITPTGDWQTSAQIKTATATEAAFFALRVALVQAADANLSPYYCNYIKVIDLTLLYGAGHEPASVAAFLADYPTFDPAYDAGSLQSNKTSLLRAYDGGTLRGTLALNLATLTSGGVVVFPDGMRGAGAARDEAYGSTGIVRMGRVNLGTKTWYYNANGGYFYTNQSGKEPGLENFICAKYDITTAALSNMPDKTIRGHITNNAIYVKDTAYGSDPAAFGAAMSGVYLDYELATPLTYTLDTPLPTDLTCEQGDILQRVSDNNCPFVGEMKFGL